MSALIEIKNLTKSFTSSQNTVTVLKNVNLSINSGEIYGIIGLSAAGKSKLKKACKLFAYSQSEDDPRDKRAQEIYTDISDYLENQPMEFWETVDCRRGKLEDLLCEAYDKVYGK